MDLGGIWIASGGLVLSETRSRSDVLLDESLSSRDRALAFVFAEAFGANGARGLD